MRAGQWESAKTADRLNPPPAEGLVRAAERAVGGTCYVLLGTLPHSSRVRGVLAEPLDQPHLIEAIDAVPRRHGGTPRIWRTGRLATVIVPGSRDVQPSFAPVDKYYGSWPSHARRAGEPQRRGGVLGGYACGRWWRTITATTPEQAQRSLDAFCAGPADARPQRTAEGARTTVGTLAAAEPLLALPSAPYRPAPGGDHHARQPLTSATTR
jgi:hypothetical protein